MNPKGSDSDSPMLKMKPNFLSFFWVVLICWNFLRVLDLLESYKHGQTYIYMYITRERGSGRECVYVRDGWCNWV